jgi:DNA-binding LacI/PurR family transcriptional regulator
LRKLRDNIYGRRLIGIALKARKNQLELARKLGVSVSTVSRALSDSPGIGEDLRRQIQKLANEVGYQARGSKARSSKTASRKTVALVTLDRVTGGLASFYDGVLDGMLLEARRSSMDVDVRLIEERAFDLKLFRGQVDPSAAGMFFVGIDPPEDVRDALASERIPTVLVNGLDPLMRFDSVAPANFFGAYHAARILLDAGHRSLLYVTSELRATTQQRLRGFCAAVTEIPSATVEVCELAAPTREEAEKAVDRLVTGQQAWTGVFCMNDLYAIGVVQALQGRGLRVPDDVSVLGFDDLPFASMMSPRLSTMRVEREAIGRQGVELMNRRLENPGVAAVHVDVSVVPVTGGTVRSASQ